jgi:mannose-6-phosphate isomerase-like protein (cupin superfamily)
MGTSRANEWSSHTFDGVAASSGVRAASSVSIDIAIDDPLNSVGAFALDPALNPAHALHPGPCTLDRYHHSMEKISLSAKLAQFADHWNPRLIGELNGQHVKLTKLKGAFIWHQHEHEDELFLVVNGRFRMEFRDRDIWLEAGEMLIVPRGVEHRPVAEEEASVLLFEPATTVNTGNVVDERTRHTLEKI